MPVSAISVWLSSLSVRVTTSPGATPTGSTETLRLSAGSGAGGVGRGLVNARVWGEGVGVGSGEVKLGEWAVAVWPLPERMVGPGIKVDNNDRTTSNEIFWLNDVSWIILASCA